MHDPHLFVTANTFEKHIMQISKKFKIVNLKEILNTKEKKNLCAITFDDGWLDNYDIAFPVLKQHRVPATIFIPVEDIGTTHCFWFEKLFYLANEMKTKKDMKKYIEYFQDKEKGWSASKLTTSAILKLIEKLKSKNPVLLYQIINIAFEKFKVKIPSEKMLLDWNQVREMGRYGITFGSHGLNHDIISKVDRNTKVEIVFKSFDLLKDKKINYTSFFSYPNGNWDIETINLLHEAGYKGAVTTEEGNNTDKNSAYLLKRIGLSEKNSRTSGLFWFIIGKAILRA